LRGNFFAGDDETAEGFGMVESADVTDGEAVGIGDDVKSRELQNVEIEREAVHAVFLAIEIAHAPTGDVDALRGAEDARESAGQERTEEAVAVGADPGGKGVVVHGEVNFFAEVEKFGGDGDPFVVSDDPVKIGGDLFDEVSNGGF